MYILSKIRPILVVIALVLCPVVVSQEAPDATASVESATARAEASLERLNRRITDQPSPVHHMRAGILFELERFEEALRDYDVAATLGDPHDDDSCWEQGLAQYYVGDFKAGRDQFARYHTVGARDIENGIWRFLCIAEDEGIEKARASMFAYPEKLRTPFPALLDLYLGKGSEAAVLDAAKRDVVSPAAQTERLFYAHYYLGKYYEITGDRNKAQTQVKAALDYRIGHFMYTCAKIDAGRLAGETTDE